MSTENLYKQLLPYLKSDLTEDDIETLKDTLEQALEAAFSDGADEAEAAFEDVIRAILNKDYDHAAVLTYRYFGLHVLAKDFK